MPPSKLSPLQEQVLVALRTTATFAQLDVRRDTDAVVIDLVADPTPIAEPPQAFPLGDLTILVETPHQLLVNKLCALLSRSELRDLVESAPWSKPVSIWLAPSPTARARMRVSPH